MSTDVVCSLSFGHCNYDNKDIKIGLQYFVPLKYALLFVQYIFISNRFFPFRKIGSIQNPPVPSNSRSNQQWGNSTINSAISKRFCLDLSEKSPSASLPLPIHFCPFNHRPTFWTMFKKTALFWNDGFPKLAEGDFSKRSRQNPFEIAEMIMKLPHCWLLLELEGTGGFWMLPIFQNEKISVWLIIWRQLRFITYFRTD